MRLGRNILLWIGICILSLEWRMNLVFDIWCWKLVSSTAPHRTVTDLIGRLSAHEQVSNKTFGTQIWILCMKLFTWGGWLMLICTEWGHKLYPWASYISRRRVFKHQQEKLMTKNYSSSAVQQMPLEVMVSQLK
jgi:hypothetical protein